MSRGSSFLRDRFDLEAAKAGTRISAVVGRRVQLRRSGAGWLGCCPFHEDRTPSFTVNDDKGTAHCFGCGWHGDVIDFLMAADGSTLPEAVKQLAPGSAHVPRPSKPPADSRDTRAEALAIWRASGPVAATQAEVYLRARGIAAELPESLRFSRLRYGSNGAKLPCLVALVVGPDNKVAGIQRTFLKGDGSGKADVPKPKLSLGRISGGAIRLAPAAAHLVVTEGLEDGLTLQQELGRPVWVAAGASLLPSMHVPPAVTEVTIGADGDAAGDNAAQAAAAAFRLDGRVVRVMKPEPDFKDFNDQLRGVRRHG